MVWSLQDHDSLILEASYFGLKTWFCGSLSRRNGIKKLFKLKWSERIPYIKIFCQR
jgi:hypothetical protein